MPDGENTRRTYSLLNKTLPPEILLGHAHRSSVEGHQELHRTPKSDEAVARPTHEHEQQARGGEYGSPGGVLKHVVMHALGKAKQ